MNEIYITIRSLVLWPLGWINFAVGVPFVLLLKALFGQWRMDPVLRLLAHNIMFLAGTRIVTRFSPGFDPKRVSFILSNHVNMFDPFILYSVVPQLFRGLELESHFQKPVYGWLMKGFGNVPVTEGKTTADVRKTFRLTKNALEQNISLLVFPEGGRTSDGRVGPFNDGAFVMAVRFNYPIVPVSIVNSFEFKNKDTWKLRPATIEVHFHDTIDTTDLTRSDVPALRDRVRSIIAAPVDADLDAKARRDLPVESPV